MSAAVASEIIEIVEVGPRDGLQSEGTTVATITKLELIHRLANAGLRRIEVASFVNPKRVPQMADAEAVLAGVEQRPGVQYVGLILNQRGLERAIAAGCSEVGMVVAATESFAQRNQGASIDEAITAWEAIAPQARAQGIRAQVTISTAFGCPFEGEVPVEQVVRIAERLARAEPLEIALADTIGVAVPRQVKRLVGAVHAAIPHIPLRCHFHNTRNTGIANADAAVDAGVRVLDASVGGIGGCPFAPRATGNIATEDLVYLLERSGCRTNVNLERLIDVAQWLEEQLAKPLPSMVAKAGAFPRLRTS
jgi:hydroxymethylglutaryl-CoA lyase